MHKPEPLGNPSDPSHETNIAGSPKRIRGMRHFSVIGVIVIVLALASFGVFYVLNSKASVDDTIQADAAEVQAKHSTMELVAVAKKLQKDPNNSQLKAQAEDLAAKRKESIKSFIKSKPKAAIAIQFPADLRSKLSLAAQGNIETAVVQEGTLTVTHGESLDAAKHTLKDPFYIYKLSGTGSTISTLHFEGEGPSNKGGSKVRVKGVQLGDVMAVAAPGDVTVTSAPTVVAATTASTSEKVAVILLNFSDKTTEPWTPAAVKTAVFGSTSSVNNFYEEQSFNKVGLTGKVSPDGDVLGWFHLSNSSAGCDYGTWSTNALAAAKAAGNDMTGYTHFVYAWPELTTCTSGGGEWAGLGQMPGNTVWINGFVTNKAVVSHELGHNFGAHHANSYKCTDAAGAVVTISSNCVSTEYGDNFDVMGAGWYDPIHMNAFHKGELGYFANPGNVLTASASGTYTIAPIETATTGLQSLRIPTTFDATGKPTNYYYLEYRQNIGYDKFVVGNACCNTTEGVLVHLAPNYSSIQSQLLDMTPATVGNGDQALVPGKTFTDTIHNISITTQSVSAAGVVVQVTLAPRPCVRNNPTVVGTPTSQWGNAGDTLNYSVAITNNDSGSCATSIFSLASTAPASITQTPATAQVSLAPGASANVAVAMVSGAAAAGGYYAVTEKVTNTSATTYTGSSTLNYNIYQPADTVAPTVKVNSPANNSTIGNNTTISATATDNVGVTSMEIYIDGVRMSTVNGGTINYTWRSRKFSRGTHVIVVKAYDASGNTGTSTVTVTK